MAFINAIKTCDFSEDQLSSIWENEEKNIPKWALEDYFEASLIQAERIKNYPKMAYFKARLSQFAPNRQEKEAFLLEAIKWDKRPEYLEMLYKVSPRFSPSDLKENIFSAGLDFERVRNFEKARSIYRKVIDEKEFSFKEKVLAFNQLALSYKKERKLSKFIEKIKEQERWLKRLNPSNEILDALARCQVDLARAEWTEHRRSEGEKILTQVIKSKFPNQNYLAEAYWVLAMMALEKKDFDPVIKWLELASSKNITDLNLKDKVNWAIGWNYYLLKDFKKAIFYFDRYENITENYHLKLKIKYWKAISYKKLNNIPKYKKEINEILKENPYSYYGVLSQKELKIPFTPIKRKEFSPKSIIPELEWLYAMGELKTSKNFLIDYVKTIKDPEEIIGLYFRINWYKEVINYFNKIDPLERFSLHQTFLSFVFPRPLEKEVKEISSKFSIQESLIYSIARQESGFDENARSLADAFGIMQVTPEMAKKMAQEFKIKYETASDLYNPKINFELGTAVIKDLITRFENDYVSIVSSYNASYKSVEVWKKERFNGDHLEYIELIPYEETQNFIKLVTRNYFLYKRLEAKEKFIFPDNFFNSI